MKILIHGLNFSPELIGIGKYTGEMAVWLQKAGHEVKVVTSPPYYPDWKVKKPYKSWKYQSEKIRDLTVIRCPIWVPRKPSGITRIIHLSTFAVSSFFALMGQIRWKPDIVLNVSPTILSTPVSLLLACLSKSKTWLQIQDFELDTATNLGMIKSDNLLIHWASNWERTILSKFDKVSSISNQMVKRLEAKGVAQEKIVLFPNWVDTDSIYPIPQINNSIRKELGFLDNQIVILYSGNMGYKQGLDLLVSVAEQMRSNPNLVFVLCGNGAARPELEQKSKSLANIHFMDLQPLEKLNELLNAADIHILPQQANAADLVMPSKLLGMMASAKPIIATARPGTELANVVNQIGIVIPPQSVEAVVSSILKLVESPELRTEFGEKARDYVINHWSTEKVLGDFEQQLFRAMKNESLQR